MDADSAALRQHVAELQHALADGLVERETEARARSIHAHAHGARTHLAAFLSRQVRLLLLAALCGEHLLLLGPPGTAKSELVRAAPSSLPVDVLLLLTWPRGAARRAAG